MIPEKIKMINHHKQLFKKFKSLICDEFFMTHFYKSFVTNIRCDLTKTGKPTN